MALGVLWVNLDYVLEFDQGFLVLPVLEIAKAPSVMLCLLLLGRLEASESDDRDRQYQSDAEKSSNAHNCAAC